MARQCHSISKRSFHASQKGGFHDEPYERDNYASKILTIVFALLFQLLIPIFSFAQVNEDCGLPAALELLQEFGEVAGRPTLSGPVVNINTTNFKIHYTLSGTDSTTSAWAESVAVYAEHCWTTVSNLGWALPPSDGANGGDSRYDIYIRNTPPLNYWGATHPESSYPTPYQDGYTSWIDVHKDSIAQPFPKWARLRALVAHEFHHACQLRYSGKEQRPWIYENTSVYMEDVIYDDVNTLPYRFTQGVDPLDSPHLPISYDHFPYYYPGGIWPTFLHEHYGNTAPRMCTTVFSLPPLVTMVGVTTRINQFATLPSTPQLLR